MVEVTLEVREAADTLAHRICGCATTEQHKADIAAILAYRQAAFNAGRASVVADLESPSEAMVEAGADALGDEFGSAPVSRADDENGASAIFTAMIGAYKEAGGVESNECICPKCGIRHGGRVGDGGF